MSGDKTLKTKVIKSDTKISKSETKDNKSETKVNKKELNVKLKSQSKKTDNDSDDSDNDSDNNSNDDSNDDSDDESDNDSDNESDNDSTTKSSSNEEQQELEKEKIKKEKSKKLTHVELTKNLINNEEKITEIVNKLTEYDTLIKPLERELTNLRKTNFKFLKLLDKAHDDDISKTRKEKKKRKVTENSGILRNKPVPPVLISFLNLDVGTELPRTKIMSLLCNKFKNLGFGKGQNYHLDKPTARIFGKDKELGNYKLKDKDGIPIKDEPSPHPNVFVIEFKYFQRFLKEIYDHESAVVL